MSPDTPRKQKLILNTVFGGLSWLMPIIIGFVATPIILRHLGASQYGIYATILGFVSYSFAFSIGKVLVKYVAEFRASGESDKISSVVSASFWLSLILAGIGTSIVAIFARQIVSNVLAIPPEHQELARIAIYLACGAIVVTMIGQAFQLILQGLHLFGRFLLLTNLSGILLNLGNIGFAWAGYDMNVLLTWNLVSLSLMALAYGWIAVRNLPEFSLSPAAARLMMGPVVKYGLSILLYQAIGNLLFLFERAWVIRKFGSEAATYYLVPMTLGIYLHGAVTSSLQATFPMLNEILADRPRMIELYKKATKLVVGIVGFALLTIIVTGRSFLSLWIDPTMAERGYEVLVMHTFAFAFIALLTNVWGLAEGYRMAGLNVLLTFVWAIVAIPLMIWAGDSYGYAGVAASRLAGVAVTLPMILYYEKRFLGRSLYRFWGAIGVRLAVMILIGAAAEVAVRSIMPMETWAAFVVAVATGGILYLASGIAIGYITKEERSIVSDLMLRRA